VAAAAAPECAAAEAGPTGTDSAQEAEVATKPVDQAVQHYWRTWQIDAVAVNVAARASSALAVLFVQHCLRLCLHAAVAALLVAPSTLVPRFARQRLSSLLQVCGAVAALLVAVSTLGARSARHRLSAPVQVGAAVAAAAAPECAAAEAGTTGTDPAQQAAVAAEPVALAAVPAEQAVQHCLWAWLHAAVAAAAAPELCAAEAGATGTDSAQQAAVAAKPVEQAVQHYWRAWLIAAVAADVAARVSAALAVLFVQHCLRLCLHAAVAALLVAPSTLVARSGRHRLSSLL